MSERPTEPQAPAHTFGGYTASNRIVLAELYEDHPCGEPLVVVKVSRPFPEDFRDGFPDADKGTFPGGTWEVLPREGQAEGERPDGALFQTQGFTLEYALLLAFGLTSLLEASGRLDELLDRVTALKPDGEEILEVPLRAVVNESAEGRP